MGTSIAPLRTWTREEIKSSEEATIQFIKAKQGVFFMLNGVSIGSKVANYLLSLCRKEDKVHEEAVIYWMGVMKDNKFYYYGGHSTIHIDVEGKLMDWHEKLSALARLGPGYKVSVNVHLGMFVFLHSIIRANETPIAPMQVFKSIPSIVEEPKYIKVVPKEAEYVAKCPKAAAIIMAMGTGDFNLKSYKKMAATWEKQNNPVLLYEYMGDNEGERLSKISTRFLTATEWNALRYLTALADADASNIFFTLIQAEARLNPTHPIVKLRAQIGNSSNYVSRDYVYRMALVIKAWNSYTSGLAAEIEWDRDKEEFPKIK